MLVISDSSLVTALVRPALLLVLVASDENKKR